MPRSCQGAASPSPRTRCRVEPDDADDLPLGGAGRQVEGLRVVVALDGRRPPRPEDGAAQRDR